MFKKFMMIIVFSGGSFAMLESNFKIAISAKDFHDGNSLVLIARDIDGSEQVAGYVPLHEGKTEFSLDEISYHDQTLLSVSEQKAIVITDSKADSFKKDDDLIYLYFEVDAAVNIVRAIVITNNLLADKPFDVIEISTSSMLEQDDEDDFFADVCDDGLSNLNLTDIQTHAPTELSFYNKTMLAVYALWAIKSAQVKQAYKNFMEWCTSSHAK